MVDRILHIGHKLAGEYNKELLQRTAEVSVYKGSSAVIPYLIDVEKLDAAEAEALALKIDAEMKKVNRQVLLQYLVILGIFAGVFMAALIAQAYVFALFPAVPVFILLYSMSKFIRRNPLR